MSNTGHKYVFSRSSYGLDTGDYIIGNYAGEDKWAGGTLGTDGKLYFSPSSSDSILVLNPLNDSVSFIDISSYASGRTKFAGAVSHPNGKVYFVPRLSGNMLILDLSDYTIEILSFTGNFCDGNLGPDGKIYLIPTGTDEVVEIDVDTNSVTYYSGAIQGVTSSERQYYQGSVLGSNGKIYGVARGATKIIEFDTVSKNISHFGDLSGQERKYNGGILGSNNKIYFSPFDADSILEVDYLNQEINLIPTDITGTGKWRTAFLSPNGQIYFLPRDAQQILRFNPLTYTQTLINNPNISNEEEKYYGSVSARNGKQYLIPYKTSSILVLTGVGESQITSDMYTIPSDLSQLPNSIYNRMHNKF